MEKKKEQLAKEIEYLTDMDARGCDYLDIINECQRLLDIWRQEEAVSSELQKEVLRILRKQFDENMAGRNRHLLQGQALEKYLQAVTGCLKKLPNNLFRTGESVEKDYRLPYTMWSAFMRLKYEDEVSELFIKDGMLFCSNKEVNQKAGFLPVVMMELMELESSSQEEKTGTKKPVLRIDAAVDQFILEGVLKFEVLLNGKVLGWEESPRFSHRDFFGKAITERKALVLRIPVEHLGTCSQLQFVLHDGAGNSLYLPMVSIDYQAKLTTVLKRAYWCFGPYMATYEGHNRQNGAEQLVLEKAGKGQRIRRELGLLKEILKAPYGSKRMFSLRCLYWLTYPFYSKKNIWVTFDKLYKGGDCGEYFYKFLEAEAKDIVPVYVIKNSVPDWKRLAKEGYHPSAYGSTKQRLMYLHAKMIFATHSSVHSFCGFSKWEVRFIQDRLRAVNTCIQHGLSVQDLTFDSNRIVNNNKRYYCASRYEVENLSRPAYDYDPDVLRLTGIPRYDGLINQDKKQILITPTWRAYIAMPAVMGESRPYNPDFKNTDYYRIFQSLLENKKLSDMAAKTGYKIVYLLHPVISSQKEDFRPANDIEIVSAVDVNYEKILTESSLMVTDYSGVQFDFAYMRKPVVYFHPPKLPPHYEEGGFFYDTQGFGEICKEIDELVDVLCGYMETGCQLKEFYRARQDDFFAFEDLESCRRIYEDALEYQRGNA